MKTVIAVVLYLVTALILADSPPVSADTGMAWEADSNIPLTLSDSEFMPAKALSGNDINLSQMDFFHPGEDSARLPFGEVSLAEPLWERNRLMVHFRCAEQSANIDWLQPPLSDEEFVIKDLPEASAVKSNHYPSLQEARLVAASRLPQHARFESGYILYEREDGSIGISERLSGSSHSLDPFSIASLGGRTVTIKGTHGVDGYYPVLEIVHTHPPQSTHLHSGGHGAGDIYVAESLGVAVSVVHDNEIRLYNPQGRKLTGHFHQVRGELVAMLGDN